MDCLGLVGNREIPTPPCLAWAEMFDNGRSGICEADLNAVMSHELCLKLLDKPGFQQDPVAETEHNTLIGATASAPRSSTAWTNPRNRTSCAAIPNPTSAFPCKSYGGWARK